MADPRVKPTKDISADAQWGALGDAGNVQVGNSGRLLVVGDKEELIRIAGENQLARYVSITCDLSLDGPLDPDLLATVGPQGSPQMFVPRVKGIIQWGNGGVVADAEFDFSNGTIVSVAAATVRVVAVLEEQFNDAPGPFPVRVKAHVDYLPRASAPAQRTIYAPTLGPGETVVFPLPVPRYAKRVRVERYLGQAIEFLLIDPFLGPVAAVATSGPIDLPVPNGARFWVATNLDATDDTNIGAVFDLWL